MTLLHCVEVEVIYYRCFSLEFKALGTRWCDCSSRGVRCGFTLFFRLFAAYIGPSMLARQLNIKL